MWSRTPAPGLSYGRKVTATDREADRASRPGSPSSLRAANRQRLLDAVRDLGPMTQTEVARATGLSAGTVSNLVHELTEAGMLTATISQNPERQGHDSVLVLDQIYKTGTLPPPHTDTGVEIIDQTNVGVHDAE